MTTPLKAELFESVHRFVVAAANDEMTEELAADFARLLQESDDACDIYAECVQMSLLLPSILAANPEENLDSNDAAFLEQNGHVSALPFLPFLGNAVHGAVGYFSSGWPAAYLVATVLLGIGLFIGSQMHVSQPAQVARQPVPSSLPRAPGSPSMMESVGRITAMVDCQWEGSGFRVQGSGENESTEYGVRRTQEDGNAANQRSEIRNQRIPNQKPRVALGDKFALSSGLLEVTYDTGAKVVLQGPCTYEVESRTSGFLSIGKLTARVESTKYGVRSTEKNSLANHSSSHPQSPIPNPLLSTTHDPLFTVKTPTATVTDLGTEFGVEVDQRGLTTSHVFRGSVRLQLFGVDGEEQSGVVVLKEGESATTEANVGQMGMVMRRVSVNPQTFVRRVVRSPETLDLLDIVAGGYGTTLRRERGIDATTGMEDPTFSAESRSGDGTYCRVTWHKLIDGVFTPSGGDGPVVVDSAGHTFAGFPPTSRLADSSIWARAVSFKPDDRATNFRYWVYAMGQGESYMPNRSGLLALATNKGITFNLEAIRTEYPGVRPVRFRAVAAVANASGLGFPEGLQVADVWVLVDGQLKLSRPSLQPQDGAMTVDIALGPKDRFLTLASTWNGSARNYDWVIFGDPVLEMATEQFLEAGPSGKEVP